MDTTATTTANLPIEKATISGATLSSLLNHLNTTATTTTGHLYGTLSLITTTALSDDPPSLTPPPSSLIAVISSFSATPSTTPTPIGTFSIRRLAPSRPSLLDHSLSQSLTLTQPEPVSSIFLLLTTPPVTQTQTLIHTFDYRLYSFSPVTLSYEAIALEVVNIGPGFRAQYGVFSPKCGLPWLPGGQVGSPMKEDGNGKSLREMKRDESDQKELSGYVADGYEVGSLGKLVGSEAVGYMVGVEDLYENMLAKLRSLARVVELSSARVLDLENQNMKLRRRVTGIE